ncbi:MAG: S8 family serine peptidase [Patescibacteria group bacterium]|nr:S8 family serine peptidase [Patescibacteria group bacterium]
MRHTAAFLKVVRLFARYGARRIWLRVISVLVAALAIAGSTGIFSPREAGAQRSRARNDQVGEVLVRLRSGGPLLRLRFAPDVSLDAVLNEYRRRPEVLYAERNSTVHAMAFPNDPNFSKQWYLSAIQGRDAWSAELIDEEGRQLKLPVIAILDTGVDVDHPDLQGKIWNNSDERPGDGVDNDHNGYVDDWQGWDFVANIPDPTPKFDSGYLPEAIHHGTIVAGIAAAASHNSIGVTGVSWTAKIMSLRVLDAEGNGTIYDVVRAVEYATAQKADVINLSFVGVEYSQALYDTLKAAAAKGIVVVAAAGNTTDGNPGIDLAANPEYPICLDAQDSENFIIGVAAVNGNRQLTGFSNYGKGCVDLVAPGENFFGLLVNDASRPGFTQLYGGSWSGTSVAVPLVSGAAAVARSLRPGLSAAAVREILLRSVDDVVIANPKHAGQLGSGQINLLKVVEQAIAQRGLPGTETAPPGLIIAGLGFRSFPQIKLFTPSAQALKSFFAYAPTFNSSIAVAAGDVTGDGLSDVVTGAGPGGGPHVRVFNREGQVEGQFFAFDSRTRFGINVAVGNVDGVGAAEIIVAPAGSSQPQVEVFNVSGEHLADWLAYDPRMTGGVNLAAGDVDGDGRDEIITGAGLGGGSEVKIFEGDGTLQSSFFALSPFTRTGVTVGAGDVDGDGRDEILASPVRGGQPMVYVFDYGTTAPQATFFAFTPNFTGGVNLAAGDVDGDGRDEIITGAGPGGGPHVRWFDRRGQLKGEFFAHDAAYRGGVRVGFLR